MAAYRALVTLAVAALTLGLFTAATPADATTDDASCWCESDVNEDDTDASTLCEEPETPTSTTSTTLATPEIPTSSTSTTLATPETPTSTTSTTLATPETTSTSTTAATTSTTAATTTTAAPPTTEAAPTTTLATSTTAPPPPETTPSTEVAQEREQLPVTGPTSYLPIAVLAAVGLLALGSAALVGSRKQR